MFGNNAAPLTLLGALASSAPALNFGSSTPSTIFFSGWTHGGGNFVTRIYWGHQLLLEALGKKLPSLQLGAFRWIPGAGLHSTSFLACCGASTVGLWGGIIVPMGQTCQMTLVHFPTSSTLNDLSLPIERLTPNSHQLRPQSICETYSPPRVTNCRRSQSAPFSSTNSPP